MSEDPSHFEFAPAVWILWALAFSLASNSLRWRYLENGEFFGGFGWSETTEGTFVGAAVPAMYDLIGFGFADRFRHRSVASTRRVLHGAKIWVQWQGAGNCRGSCMDIDRERVVKCRGNR